MDALTLEQEALKLSPLSRIRLADLLYTSLEVEADREWNRKAIAECESRYEAYKNGKWDRAKDSASLTGSNPRHPRNETARPRRRREGSLRCLQLLRVPIRGLGTQDDFGNQGSARRDSRFSGSPSDFRSHPRKRNLKKFPYGIIFRIDGEEVVFVACFHLRSDPAKWKELLKAR